MTFGGFYKDNVSRVLPNGLLLASQEYLVGYEREVPTLKGVFSQDAVAQITVTANTFDKVRTWLQVGKHRFIPYLDFQVGASTAETAQNLLVTLQSRGYRAAISGSVVTIRFSTGELPLVEAPYGWGTSCLTVTSSGSVVPGLPVDKVFVR